MTTGIDTSFKKFGAGSWQYSEQMCWPQTIGSEDFYFADGDFTVEFLLGAEDANYKSGLLGFWLDYWYFSIDGETNTFTFNVVKADDSLKTLSISGWTQPSSGTFKHYAAVRHGDTLLLYEDCVLKASTEITGSLKNPTSDSLMLRLVSGDPPFNVDEFCITKGLAKYTGESFPCPTEELDLEQSEIIRYVDPGPLYAGQGTGFADPYAGFQISYANLVADDWDISTGDFCIIVKWRINCKYEYGPAYDGLVMYHIIGQFKDFLYNPASGAEQGYWWALEFCDDNITFRVYDSATKTYKIDLSTPVTINWEEAWTDYRKANLDPGWIEIVVARRGDTARLLIDGIVSDEGSAANWTAMQAALQISAQSGRLVPDVPICHTTIYEAVTFDETCEFWDNYTPLGWLYYERKGIGILPRFDNPYLYVGTPGTIWKTDYSFAPRMTGEIKVEISMTGDYGITPGLSGEINIPIEISGTLGITVRCSGQLTYLGEDITEGKPENFKMPSLEFSGEGWVTITGVISCSITELEADFSARINERGPINVTIPSLTNYVDFEGEVVPSGSFGIEIPGIAFYGTAIQNISGIFSKSMPAFHFVGTGLVGEMGTIEVIIPSFSSALSSVLSAEGTLSVSIPLPIFASEQEASDYLTMVLNIKNKALTLYDNYDFNSMCRFGGKHFGATKTKIYDLDTGTTDDGTAIEWKFKTGYLDLEQKRKKKLRQAWLSYKTNGDVLMTVIQHDGTEYEYNLEGIYQTETGLRVKFGKGIKSKYVALEVENVDGSTIVLDVLRLNMIEVDKAR
jgi:hypothetical protein